MEKLLATLNDYLTQAGQMVKTYAPQAWEATLHLIQLSAILHLIGYTILTIILGVSIYLIPRFLRWAQKEEWDGPAIPALVFLTFYFLFFGGLVVVSWSNSLVYWIGAFHPELAVIYKLAEKAGLLT